MKYWRKARLLGALLFGAMATIVALLLPITVLTATPSPGGATVGLATVLALAVPVIAGWSISRGDCAMEQRSVRPVAMLDLGLVLIAAITVATGAAALRAADLSPVGLIAARATVTYTGLMLAAVGFVGWANASMAPVVYFVAVVIAGRGSDVEHPAIWAWIAAREDATFSLAAALVTLATGIIVFLRTAR